jgi:multiple sugar transport system substrate-binding protein
MFKILTAIASVMLILCGRPLASQAQTTTLNVTATPAIFKAMFEELVAKFEAQNPQIKIALTVPPGEQDVALPGYNHIRVLTDRGLTVPLEPFIKSDASWKPERFSASVVNSATLNGVVRGLGVGVSFPVLYYNVDMVKQAQGGDAAFPTSWDGVIALAKKIGASQPGVIGAFHRFDQWMFQAQVESRGGALMSADEKAIRFDGAEGLAALQLYQTFAEAGQSKSAMTREQARQAFIGGTVGIFTDSSSLLQQHTQQVGGKFQIGVAPFPAVQGKGRIPAAGIASVMLTPDKTRQDAAWRFMTFVSSPEGQVIVATKTAYVPANAVAVARADLLGDYYKERPLMQAALTSLPFASPWYSFPGANSVKIEDVIRNRLQAVATLEQTPVSALAAMKTEVEALLPR